MTIDGGASGAGRRAFVSPEVSSRRHTPCHDRPRANRMDHGYSPWGHGDSLITGTPCWRLPCNVKGSSRERDPSSVRPGRLTQESKHAAAPLRAVDFRLALGNVDGRGIGGTMMKWLRWPDWLLGWAGWMVGCRVSHWATGGGRRATPACEAPPQHLWVGRRIRAPCGLWTTLADRGMPLVRRR